MNHLQSTSLSSEMVVKTARLLCFEYLSETESAFKRFKSFMTFILIHLVGFPPLKMEITFATSCFTGVYSKRKEIGTRGSQFLPLRQTNEMETTPFI